MIEKINKHLARLKKETEDSQKKDIVRILWTTYTEKLDNLDSKN